MKIDLSSVIKVLGAQLDIDNKVSLADAQFLGDTYTFTEPLNVTGRVYNNGQSLTLDVAVSGRIITECARCLSPIEVDVFFDVHELLSQRENEDEVSEDIILFDGHEIELDDIVADNFLMNVYGKYLCRDDCRGLCANCGKNLNEGDCSCSDDYVAPGWEALADILNQQKD